MSKTLSEASCGEATGVVAGAPGAAFMGVAGLLAVLTKESTGAVGVASFSVTRAPNATSCVRNGAAKGLAAGDAAPGVEDSGAVGTVSRPGAPARGASAGGLGGAEFGA